MGTFEVGQNTFLQCGTATSLCGQGVECDVLNKNALHSVIDLNAWSPGGGTI